jgi:hypothetical protein
VADPESHSEMGKPKANAHWRARVLPITLNAIPTAQATAMAHTSAT